MLALEPKTTAARFAFSVAEPSDDVELRLLLRRISLGHQIEVTFEREPDFFTGSATQGDFHQTVIARDNRTQQIVGFGSRAIRTGYLNGARAQVGYLGDLRLDPDFRCGSLLARGYRFFRELHADGRADAYYTVIFTDNHTALQTLVGQRARLPQYKDRGLIHAPGLQIRRRLPNISSGRRVERANQSDWPEIIDCLNRNNSKKQFAPLYQLRDFTEGRRWPGLSVENFWVARDRNRIVGTLAIWNQISFKQTRIIRYRGSLAWKVPLSNRLRVLTRAPRFPKPSEIVPYLIACCIAVDEDAVDVFRQLVRAAYNASVGTNFCYLIIGLHEHDPLAVVLQEYPRVPFTGRLFEVIPDSASPIIEPRKSFPYIEVATL